VSRKLTVPSCLQFLLAVVLFDRFLGDLVPLLVLSVVADLENEAADRRDAGNDHGYRVAYFEGFSFQR
jgi:hypothetical protein